MASAETCSDCVSDSAVGHIFTDNTADCHIDVTVRRCDGCRNVGGLWDCQHVEDNSKVVEDNSKAIAAAALIIAAILFKIRRWIWRGMKKLWKYCCTCVPSSASSSSLTETQAADVINLSQSLSSLSTDIGKVSTRCP